MILYESMKLLGFGTNIMFGNKVLIYGKVRQMKGFQGRAPNY